ncbi:MAG: glycerol-3-phosphate 1-O-acyltransferase PlsY [Endomicrobium sp.]|jgi:glycerol-3-phosphate acyltransferase PlsY|nr:glycerol-3-phosphate 1-O-acyltransferase PlsY [Endomicrobium sp.]
MFIKVVYVVFTYLCGSIPFAYIIAKGKNIDIRNVGSGNVGTTNVLRCIGKKAGAITLVTDILKGFLPMYFATLMYDSISYNVIVATFAILGQMFPIFLNFHGGKGVAIGFGVFSVIMTFPLFIAFSIFFIIFMISKYVSVGVICATISIPIISYYLGYDVKYVIFSFIIAVLIIYKHKSNINRLTKGIENKLEVFKK